MSTVHDAVLVVAGAVPAILLSLLGQRWASRREQASYQRDVLTRLLSSLTLLQMDASDAAALEDLQLRKEAVIALRADIARVSDLGLQVHDRAVQADALALSKEVVWVRAEGSNPRDLFEIVPACDRLKERVGLLLSDWPRSTGPRPFRGSRRSVDLSLGAGRER